MTTSGKWIFRIYVPLKKQRKVQTPVTRNRHILPLCLERSSKEQDKLPQTRNL